LERSEKQQNNVFMYDSNWMRDTHKCCSCERPLTDDPDSHINLVQTDYKTEWKYPSFGNVIEGTQGMAAAILCSSCLQKKPMEIKFVLEYQDQLIIYHPVETLKLVDRLAKKSTRVK
jgi:hypothetical protein